MYKQYFRIHLILFTDEESLLTIEKLEKAGPKREGSPVQQNLLFIIRCSQEITISSNFESQTRRGTYIYSENYTKS